jgi:succinate dehydrogenase / fumarate reductase, membrane anchor subunit
MALSPGIEPRARARGLGSAKQGVHAWTAERISAVALVPLMLWLIASVIVLHGASYVEFVAWLRRPLSSLLMLLSLIAIFQHTALGLQVIIEDYVHSALKVAAIVAVRLACFALCVTGLLATLRIMLMH